jgi:hypothetical protein
MEAAISFFAAVRASVVEGGDGSLFAVVSHPDGFETNVQANYSTHALSLRRRSGDQVLFEMLCEMVAVFDMGRGEAPGFFDGQLLPRTFRTSSPPLVDVPPFCLDGAGVKRKLAETM